MRDQGVATNDDSDYDYRLSAAQGLKEVRREKPLLTAIQRLDSSLDALEKVAGDAEGQLGHLTCDSDAAMKEAAQDMMAVLHQERSETTARVDQSADRVDYVVRRLNRLLRILEA